MPIEKVYGLYGKLGEVNSKLGFRAKHGLVMLSDTTFGLLNGHLCKNVFGD